MTTSSKAKCPVSNGLLLKGIPASPGIVIGKAFILDRERSQVFKIEIDPGKVEAEIERFKRAVEKTKREFALIQEQIRKQLGPDMARIFDAHLLMLRDTMAIDETIEGIRKERKNAEYVFFQKIDRVRKKLLSTGEQYLQERTVDLQDVERRVLRNLAEFDEEKLDQVDEPCILLAKFLTPSDTAQLDKKKILGFATDFGGHTSHAAIVARSLEIPAVVGLREITRKVCPGDHLVVDGTHGIVLVNPAEEAIGEYRMRRDKLIVHDRELLSLADKPPMTLDGRTVELQANIELPDEVNTAISHGAGGIGLYRTEYLYLSRLDLPDEEEQYEAYASIARRMSPAPVIIRTFDLGGDKLLPNLETPLEPNPYLGWRAIRICLDRLDLFRTQLRAILRASSLGNVKIMFPMISGVAELLKVKDVVEDVKRELRREGVAFQEDCDIGIMIEIPSAALVADRLAREVDFFSIGTNDLIQYAIAVDRSNEKIAYLYDPFHPAVLRLIQMVISAGHENGIWVGLCGEMAADPLCVWLLLGMGLDEFSMSPVAIPEAKRLIRSISHQDAKELSRKALSLPSSSEISRYLKGQLEQRLGELPLDYASELLWKEYGPRGG